VVDYQGQRGVPAGGAPGAGHAADDLRAFGELALAALARAPGAPPRIEAVLRGRWPDLPALLAALEARPRRRGLVLLAGGVALAGVAGAVLIARDRGRAPPPRIVPLTTLGGCPDSPLFIDDQTVLFEHATETEIDFYTVPAAGGAPVRRTRTAETEAYATPGRHPGEVLYTILGAYLGGGATTGALDLATWTTAPLAEPMFGIVTVVGDAIYYTRRDLRQVRRVRGGTDEIIYTLPEGRAMRYATGSHDGRHLALVSDLRDADVDRRLCLLSLDQPHALDCLEAVAPRLRPVFSPDDSAIYYASPGAIRRFDLRTRRDAVAVPGALAESGLTLSPDGRQLVFSDCTSSAELRDVRGAGPPLAAAKAITSPSLAADGSLVWAEGAAVRLRTPSGELRTLFTLDGDGEIDGPDLDAATGAVVFTRDGSAAGVWLADVAGGTPRPLTAGHDDGGALFLRDGRILFGRMEDGQQQLYVVGRDGGEPRRARDQPRITGALLADGRVLLGAVDWRSLYLWDPVTDDEQPVALPAELADGRMGYFAAGADRQSAIIVVGSQPAQVWRIPFDPGRAAELLWESPAGISIGIALEDAAGRLVVPVETWRGELYRVELPR
jgi:hypothetical protein